MFLNKVLDKKDYISLLCAYLFGIGSGLYAYTFIIPKPEPQVIVLDKLQLQKDLKMPLWQIITMSILSPFSLENRIFKDNLIPKIEETKLYREIK